MGLLDLLGLGADLADREGALEDLLIGVGPDIQRMAAEILADPHVQMSIRDALTANKVAPEFEYFEAHVPSAVHSTETEVVTVRARSWPLVQFWFKITGSNDSNSKLRIYVLTSPDDSGGELYFTFHGSAGAAFTLFSTEPKMLRLPHNYGLRFTYQTTSQAHSLDLYGNLVI